MSATASDGHFGLDTLEYFRARGIHPEVAVEVGVKEDQKGLAFPYTAVDGSLFWRRRSFNSHGIKVQQPKGTPLTSWWPAGRADNTKMVLVTEGESDALGAMSSLRHAPVSDLRGLPVVAIPGTGFPAARLADELAAAGVRQAWLALDPDDAGRAYMMAAIPALVAVGIKPFRVGLPDGCDLAECLAAEVEEERAEWLANVLFDAEAAAEIEASSPTNGAPRRPESHTEAASRAAEPLDTWPARMHEDAFHGLAGEIVRAIEPHTEADPAAILVQFLAAVGSAVGRGPGWTVEATRHHCNLYVAIVGDTAAGRKGTSWGQARRLVEMADPEWKSRAATGLSSGEGLIWQVRDPIEERRKARSKEDKENAGEDGFVTELADLGTEDKRLLVVESELASVLERMGRDGNTLSTILRQAWDGDEVLDTLVKTSPARATGAHISLIGHITADELQRKLTATEQTNGFANRFIWICARRSQLLPLGGDIAKVDWQPMLIRLRDALSYGTTTGLVGFDAEAREVWIAAYPSLTEGRRGLQGAATARAAAQVRRLAVLYALLDPDPDGVPSVGAAHLRAALAIWAYAEMSAQHLFGDRLGDPTADAIVAELRQVAPGGRTRNELRDLFGRHRRADELDRALGVLEEAGQVRREVEQTGGRPATRYFCAVSAVRAERDAA